MLKSRNLVVSCGDGIPWQSQLDKGGLSVMIADLGRYVYLSVFHSHRALPLYLAQMREFYPGGSPILNEWEG